MSDSAVRPCLRAFMADLAFPSLDVGPVLLSEFCRLASSFLSLMPGSGSTVMTFIGVPLGGARVDVTRKCPHRHHRGGRGGSCGKSWNPQGTLRAESLSFAPRTARGSRRTLQAWAPAPYDGSNSDVRPRARPSRPDAM